MAFASIFDQMKGCLATGGRKAEAARTNGQKGGRPGSRTIGEHLLRRPLDHEQHDAVETAFFRLRKEEQKALRAYFELPNGWLDFKEVKYYTRQRRKPGPAKQYILRKLRMEARWIMSQSPRPAKRPKDYVVIRELKDDWEREAWEQQHPDMPFVATRPVRIYVERSPYYDYFKMIFERHPNLTEKEILATAGARMTPQIAEAILKYLKAKYPNPRH
jgi:hypothetical protein